MMGAGVGQGRRRQQLGRTGRPGIGGKGNDGVAALVRQTNGSIGYVEYAYAKQNHMTYAADAEQVGRMGRADRARTSRRLRRAPSGPRRRASTCCCSNQPGAHAWPITGATFILMHTKQTNAQAGHDVLAFFDWAYKNGDPAGRGARLRAAAGRREGADPQVVGARSSGPNGKPVYP